jgi:hypothetical protein
VAVEVGIHSQVPRPDCQENREDLLALENEAGLEIGSEVADLGSQIEDVAVGTEEEDHGIVVDSEELAAVAAAEEVAVEGPDVQTAETIST